MDKVFSRIDIDLERRPVAKVLQVLLGDYIDRGRSSKQVISRLVARGHTHQIICLKGNHENCLLEFLRDPSTLARWGQLGGFETLHSYGLSPDASAVVDDRDSNRGVAEQLLARMPLSHLEFFNLLKPSFTCGDFFFVHAGVRPSVPLSQQTEEDLLWIRDDFLLSEIDHGKMIVHGHTPVLEPEMRRNRINIDTGAYATGRLTCIVIEEDVIQIL